MLSLFSLFFSIKLFLRAENTQMGDLSAVNTEIKPVWELSLRDRLDHVNADTNSISRKNRRKRERVVCHLRGPVANQSAAFSQPRCYWLTAAEHSVVQYKLKETSATVNSR